MELRRLGAGSLHVSVVSLGAMPWGGGFTRETKVDEDLARRLLDAALDHGVNLVDTAETYGGGLGRSEEVLGRLIRGRRDRVIVATKVGFADPGPGALRPANVAAACEASLRRLGVDHIDLYQLHRADRSVPLEETLGALEDLVQRGLVREIGISNHRAWEIAAANARQRALGRPELASVQAYYSLVGRDLEHEILPYCRARGVGLLVFSPLAGGHLVGTGDTPSAAGRRRLGALPVADEAVLRAARAVVGSVAEAHGTSRAQVALAWLLAQPGVTSVIVGPTKVEQLLDDIAAADLVLEPGELAALDEATRPDPIYPATLDRSYGFAEP